MDFLRAINGRSLKDHIGSDIIKSL